MLSSQHHRQKTGKPRSLTCTSFACLLQAVPEITSAPEASGRKIEPINTTASCRRHLRKVQARKDSSTLASA